MGDGTHEFFVALTWENSPTERLIAVVNYSDHSSQTRLSLPFATLTSETYHFHELIGTESYDRAGSKLAANGLSVDLPTRGRRVFSETRSSIGAILATQD
jgi:hypothetical protein